MSSTHTPGPWNWEATGHIRAIVGKTGERNIATLLAPYPMQHHEFVANTRLIAAAPELLEALVIMTDQLTEWAQNGCGMDDFESMRQIAADYRALLARIDGKETV